MARDVRLLTVASLLRRGKSFDDLSTGLTLIGLASGLVHLLITSADPWGLGLALTGVILGVVAKYYAFRVAFDADLFNAMAEDSPRR
jgi:hypothetical protein